MDLTQRTRTPENKQTNGIFVGSLEICFTSFDGPYLVFVPGYTSARRSGFAFTWQR